MEESVKQLWVFIIWYAGISITITIALFGWLYSLNGKLTVKEDIHGDLQEIKKSLDDIKTSLIGDFEKKGLITKHYELELRVDDLIKKNTGV